MERKTVKPAEALITPERADSADAVPLVTELEAELARHYAVESRHGYSVEKLLKQGVAFFVARIDGVPVACGGVQIFAPEYAELKRMYVRPGFRGRGIGRLMLERLAARARESGVSLLRLETGIYQTDAIRLYENYGFRRRAPFPPYFDDPVSLCYEKAL